ncbi:MAG TPA: hypothetical protein VGK19_20030 [Capsulimonadaceae bacterium]
MLVYGGLTTAALTVEDITGGSEPNPANVGDTITGTVKATLFPGTHEPDGSCPTYITYEWSTAGVYRSDTGDAGTFTTSLARPPAKRIPSRLRRDQRPASRWL